MGRGNETFEKRQREKQRMEKAEQKAARKQERQAADDTVENEGALLESFRLLSEQHDDGKIDDETFEKRRTEILEQLGIASQ